MKQIAQENIIELAKLGHERASELKASCGAVDARSLAQLISDLATQLEVQYVRAEESQREFRSADITMQNLEAKFAALAAESVTMNDKMNKLATWPGIEFYSSSWESATLTETMRLSSCAMSKSHPPTLSWLKCGRRHEMKASTMPLVVSLPHSITDSLISL